MTLSQLRDAVALLGFESSLDALDENAARHFLFCTDRALWAVERLRPRVALLRLCHDPARNLLDAYRYRHRGGETLTLTAEGAASYTFFVRGEGRVTVRDGEKSRAFSFSCPSGRRFCGLLSGGVSSLVFEGDYDYSVTDAALWDRRCSDRESDIEAGTPYAVYDAEELCEDFLRFDEPPFTERPEGARLENGHLLFLPRGRVYDCEIRYRRKHTPITPDTPDDFRLEADEDLCQLVPLLVAAYLCLDSAPDKAEFYLKLYAEQYARIKAEPVSSVAEWKTSNHW